MELSPRRRAARRAVPAALLLIAMVAGCSKSVAPPDAPPPPPPFAGVSVTSADHSVALRDLYVVDPASGAYAPGASAALAVQLWNNTDKTVSLTGANLSGAKPTATAPAGQVILVGGTESTAATFEVAVPGRGNIALTEQAGRHLRILCLPMEVKRGALLAMTFKFSNGARVDVDVPVGAWAPGTPPVKVPSGTVTC